MPARCFLAVTFEPGTLSLLVEARRHFIDAAPAWAREKWVAPEHLHLTLKFAGPLPDGQVPQVLDALAAECAAHEPFVLELAGVRAKPAHGRARMVWTTLEGDLRACSHLARSLSRVLGERFAVPEPDRPFAAHVTLARARDTRPVPPEALAAAEAALAAGKAADRSVSVRSVTLFASTLGSAGPTHDPLGTLCLGR